PAAAANRAVRREKRVRADDSVVRDHRPGPDHRRSPELHTAVDHGAGHDHRAGAKASVVADDRARMYENRHRITGRRDAIGDLLPRHEIVVADGVDVPEARRGMRFRDRLERPEHVGPGMNVVDEAGKRMAALLDEHPHDTTERRRTVDEQLHGLTAWNLRYL